MATRDTLKRLVPAMASLSDSVLDEWLTDAAAELDSTEWPATLYPKACCYLAGHLYLRAQATTAGSGAGAVTSESAGGMSRAYGTLTGSGGDAELETTIPGAELVRLRKMNVPGFYGLLPDTTYALR